MRKRRRRLNIHHQLTQVPARLRQVRRLTPVGRARGGRGVACGGCAAGLVAARGCGAAVVLRGHEGGGFFAGGVAENGLDVFVAALVGLPGGIAEVSRDVVDVELLDEGLVGCLGGGDFFGLRVDGRRHFGGWAFVSYNFTKKIEMESPHEHQQNLLLSRIITNVLNEAIVLLNKGLQEINIQNMNVELVAQMFKNYQSNVLFHLEATDSLKEPS
ncbi:hypothetical protein V496_04657 [Pseudogymnoascus sp. VKM F-4515 (FW-2607)]|nr:hypothetical protein V496_04657 [Pseudogymnoascus sp. VKM F-4515 (FW-2607)]